MTIDADVARQVDEDPSLVPAILVVDDRRENLVAIEAVLAPLQARIRTASSGDDALRMLLNEEFALVLMDVQMPGTDGFTTAELMKRHPRTAHTPIIFLTAFDERLDLAARGYSSGAVDYMSKPYDPWILRSKVQVFLDLRRNSTLIEQQTRRLEAHLEDLRRSRLELANAQRIAGIGSWELDFTDGTVRASEQLHRILGMRPDEQISRNHLLCFIGEDDASRGLALEDLRARATIERTATMPDGRTRHLVITMEPILSSDGMESRLVGTVQDVTEQRENAAALVRTQQALRDERELVDLLQRSVAPVAVPEIPEFDVASRYLAAGPGIVGGDWYDVVPLRDGTALFVIGDVAGHGLVAASAMGRIRTALRVIALDEHRPSGILQAIDRYIASETAPAFATMLAVRCDPATGQCVVASAGHLPPVTFADKPEIQWVTAGPPLGSGIRAQYADCEFTLEPGATLFLYTDGLVERRGEALDEGIARLVDVLDATDRNSESIARSVVDALCGDGPMQDDVAVLAVRRLPAASVFELAVQAEPARLGSVRSSLRRWLGAQQVERQTAEDVVLAVGELATNVCLHAYPTLSSGPLHIVGRRNDDMLEIEVRDEGAWRSEPSLAGGRGLPLLGSLGFHVELDSSDSGTTARLRVALDEGRNPEDAP